MNERLEKNLHTFLQKHYKPDRPVLLALSGGPDSLALFHLLLRYREMHSLSFAVAHVNHNWRVESTSEAEQLGELAHKFGVPYHLRTLDPALLKGNLEAACREERLQFFAELTLNHNYQAALLAHHANDQAETVLKRVFEGSGLSYLSGLQEVSTVNALILWRPLLDVTKAEITDWIEHHGLIPFIDNTNLDPRFLRGRMRSQLIPELTRSFGKEISGNLCNLADEVQEMRSHFAATLKPYLESIHKGPLGSLLDLSVKRPQSDYETKLLIREWCRNEGFCLSKQLYDNICGLLNSGKANCQVSMNNRIIYIDRRRLFLTANDKYVLPAARKLHIGSFQYGPWQVNVEPLHEMPPKQTLGFKHVWNGVVEAILPVGEYHLGPARMNASFQGGTTTISKWWNNHKVPAFLRTQVPVIWQGNSIQHEYLSPGRPLKPTSSELLRVTLTSWMKDE